MRAQAREANELAAEADRLADLARQLREKARQAQAAAKRLPGDVKARSVAARVAVHVVVQPGAATMRSRVLCRCCRSGICPSHYGSTCAVDMQRRLIVVLPER